MLKRLYIRKEEMHRKKIATSEFTGEKDEGDERRRKERKRNRK